MVLLYLLDANVLIDANRDYYPINRVPEFWEWLLDVGERKLAKVPIEIYEEIRTGNDDLAKWAKNPAVREGLRFDEEAEVSLVQKATYEGYKPDLTDTDTKKIGRDSFLLAYALKAPDARSIVTTEASKPKRFGANRHLPDVCADLGVGCYNTFQFLEILDFRTSWKKNK